jgi:hypothetical protein
MTDDLETAIAFARGLSLTACAALKYRESYPPEPVEQSSTDVQFALVTQTGSRFNVTVGCGDAGTLTSPRLSPRHHGPRKRGPSLCRRSCLLLVSRADGRAIVT